MRDLTVRAHDRVELAVRDYGGDGRDILLLHGVGRTLEDWLPVIDRMHGGRIVAMDLRWHGRSGDSGKREWMDFSRDAEAVMAALDLQAPLLVGHSFGGAIAAQCAANGSGAGVLNVDGFDMRQREIYEEVPSEVLDRFIDEWERRSTSFVPTGEGDDDWRRAQIEGSVEMDRAMGVPEPVGRAGAERSYRAIGNGGWERRPPRSFWDQTIEAGAVDVLSIVSSARVPTTVLLCTKSMGGPPGEIGEIFAAGRRGVEKHLRRISERNPLVDVQTIDASHGVIHERPAAIADLIASLAR